MCDNAQTAIHRLAEGAVGRLALREQFDASRLPVPSFGSGWAYPHGRPAAPNHSARHCRPPRT